MLPRSRRLAKVDYRIMRYRRLSQLLVLGFLILAPFFNWLRFDLASNSFYLFGERLWFRHFYLVALLVAVIVFLIIVGTVVLGRVFCGWACPQNLMNELVAGWERRFGRPGTYLLAALVSAFGAFVSLRYFTTGLPLGPFLGVTAFFFAAMAHLRTRVCKGICPYGYLQTLLTGAQTMRLEIQHLPDVADICAKCGLCYETCHMGVDPREPLALRDCVTCGDCLSACQLVSDARRVPRVLNFVVGQGGAGGASPLAQSLPALAKRLTPALGLAVGLLVVVIFLVGRRPLVEVGLVRDNQAFGGANSSFVVRIANLSDEQQRFALAVEGLPEHWVQLPPEVELIPGEVARVQLQLFPVGASGGRYPFTVVAIGAEARAETHGALFIGDN